MGMKLVAIVHNGDSRPGGRQLILPSRIGKILTKKQSARIGIGQAVTFEWMNEHAIPFDMFGVRLTSPLVTLQYAPLALS